MAVWLSSKLSIAYTRTDDLTASPHQLLSFY